MKNDTQNEMLNSLLKELGSVTELLQKSGYLKKDDEEGEEPEAESAEQAPESEEMPPQEGAPAEDQSSMEEPSQEPSEESDEGSIESILKEMDDEALQSMLQALQAEMASRGSADKAPEMPSAPQQPAPAPEMTKSMDKKHDEEKEELKKSLSHLSAKYDALSKEVASLKKPAPKTSPSKPAATSAKIQVLEKSAKAPEALSKSETLDFLLNAQKVGNRLVSTMDIVNVANSNSDAELAQYHKEMTVRGIQFPKK